MNFKPFYNQITSLIKTYTLHKNNTMTHLNFLTKLTNYRNEFIIGGSYSLKIQEKLNRPFNDLDLTIINSGKLYPFLKFISTLLPGHEYSITSGDGVVEYFQIKINNLKVCCFIVEKLDIASSINKNGFYYFDKNYIISRKLEIMDSLLNNSSNHPSFIKHFNDLKSLFNVKSKETIKIDLTDDLPY